MPFVAVELQQKSNRYLNHESHGWARIFSDGAGRCPESWAGAAFSNLFTIELAKDCENTSSSRFANSPAFSPLAREDEDRETIFMNQNVDEAIKARVRQWNKAAPVLQDVRNHDIQHADTARAMHCFTGAVLAALPKHPPLPWSGLVEQQKIFLKVRVL